MSNRYKGSIISSTAASSSSAAAYGIWKQTEVAQLINSAWPSTDQYWSSVSTLLHGDGTNGAQNNTFLDSSTVAATVTRTGTVTQGTYSPFGVTPPYQASVTGGSAYFDGSSWLATPSNAVYTFGTGDFTVEFWINATTAAGRVTGNLGTGYSAGNTFWAIDFVGGALEFGGWLTTSTISTTVTNTIVGAWGHVAWVRISGVETLYVNGVSALSVTRSLNFSGTAGAYVGVCGSANTGSPFSGYLSNVRIVKGVGVYTGAFTPPTAPLAATQSAGTNIAAITGTATSLLYNYTNAGIYDNSMLNDFTTVGSAQISTAIYKYGTGSLSFGTGNWLTTIDKTSLQLGTGDFTIEGWMYISTAGVAYAVVSKGAAATGWSVNITSGNLLQFSYTATVLTGTTALAASTWYHFAVVRSGSGTGNLKIYLNGTADATSAGAVTDNFNQTSIMYVGASRTGTTPLNGYVDDLRITKGVARYTANFTAPQQAFPNQ
jgi:hypothetical protein